jgi:cell division septation protein DedD
MSDSRVKVLSSPTVLATDNRPARIQVGSEEPVPTGTVQSPVSGGTITSSTTIQYRNTGRILTIIPQVNSQGLVHLQIKAEVSQRGADVRVGQDSFPSFDTRDAETTAVVQDGETLVIGGIITDRKSRTRTGIPYLMDIPVLGRFFGTTTDDIDRTELVMLITPHVIRNMEEARNVTDQFKEKLSTVTREIERTRKESEAQKSIPQRPSSSTPETDSKKAPRDDVTFNDVLEKAPLTEGVITEEPLVDIKPGAGEVQPPASIMAPVFKGETALKPEKSGVKGSTEEVAQPPRVANEARSYRVASKKEAKAGRETREEVWVVQVGAFRHERDGKSLAQKLKDKGYDAHVVSANIKGRIWYRVRVGQMTTREEAEDFKETFKRKENYTEAFISTQ